jgi:hypothetical protein
MKSVNKLFSVSLFAVLMLGASAAFTQDTSSNDDRELNLRAYTEMLRADVNSKRVAIITQIMEFSDADAAIFWPFFRDYDHELSKLGDTRVQLISDYIKLQIENQMQDVVAGIGAAIGALVGTTAAVAQKGEKVSIPSETVLEFRLQQPASLPART